MSRRPVALLSLLVLLVVTLLAAAASAQNQPWKGDLVLDDPAWRKSFLGSYGFLSGAEPDVRQDELALLREVIDLMKANPTAAAAMLSQQTSEESSAALDFVLANLEFQNGRHDAAVEHYESALSKFPDFRRAHKNLGLLFVQKGDFRGAARQLTRAVELGDRDGRSYGLLGYVYLNLDNPLAAEAAYRNAVLHQPDTRDWKLGLARSLLAMEKHEEANALFAALIREDPGDSAAWMLQANALLGLDRPQEAAVNLETVRLLGKAPPSSLKLLGDIYLNAGNPELAAEAYLGVIEADEAGAQFQTVYRAAELLIRIRGHEEAAKVLQRLDARYGKGLSEEQELSVLTLKAKLARAQGREAEAAELLESIVRRDGTRGDALLELARYHQGRGDRERALLLVERAQKVESTEYDALLQHAQLRVDARDYGEAARLLRRALRIRNEPRVEQFLARVEAAHRR